MKSSVDVGQIRADLLAEQAALDDVVAVLDAGQWALATASPGWTVADQIGHLAFFDHAAAVAITDPDAFSRLRAELLAGAASAEDVDDVSLGSYRALAPVALVSAWRDHRDGLAAAAAVMDPTARIAWFGPSMGPVSFLTARLMEVWAHGQDVLDTVGLTRVNTDRLRHIAQLGVITRGWSYRNRGLEPPEAPVRVQLTSPTDAVWTYGEPDATEVVAGTAEDFCLVVTQRRHLADTALATTGSAAHDWMLKAQAFAGRPSNRAPGSRQT